MKIEMENLIIRPYKNSDEQKVLALWHECNLVVPWNNPKRDIQRKLEETPDQFLMAEINTKIIGTCMFGYDGHRGWIYYFAVKPEFQRKGIATKLMRRAEERLRNLGCPKINLMIRNKNEQMIKFYKRIGYKEDPVVVLSRRLYSDEEYKSQQDATDDC
jgi:ribosomal protein S18 acetylase RimI-like enzyme